MDEMPRYLVVDSRVLPEVFGKVIEAKRLLETGTAHTVGEAVKATGISRSAFYKYKSCVHPFVSDAGGRIVTLQAMLRDEAGVLSQLTNLLYRCGANILTINQNIPIGGRAPVSVTARVDSLQDSLEGLLNSLRDIDGVENINIVAGK